MDSMDMCSLSFLSIVIMQFQEKQMLLVPQQSHLVEVLGIFAFLEIA